jgi:hypothetical protein
MIQLYYYIDHPQTAQRLLGISIARLENNATSSPITRQSINLQQLEPVISESLLYTPHQSEDLFFL